MERNDREESLLSHVDLVHEASNYSPAAMYAVNNLFSHYMGDWWFS